MEDKLTKEKPEVNASLQNAFIHNISHEIRTPMNAIVGFASLLNEPGLSDETRRFYIKMITESSDQLLAIVNDIIEISNLDAGLVKVCLKETNLNHLLSELYNRFNKEAVENGISFALHNYLSDARSVVETDSVKLSQVLSNLLENAFKFTASGKISFGYSVSEKNIRFFVTDTGIGIPAEQSGKIFERFYQIDSSASRAYEGTGLGLTISKAYIELMGGNIWVRSIQGKGSAFYFTIPYKLPKYFTEMESSGKIHEGTHNSKSVLIAEDDDNNFFLMKELLSDFNLNIIRATNGIEAVDAFRKGQKIDLVLMDIKMPLMDGYEATKEIRKINSDVAILVQTAYADDEVKAMESGCSGFISKPFVRERFLSLVKEFI
jgi:CheY-like chemotaxis protein/anti-sigma regulatory factor (Ser/Thr protein kinase)